MSQVDVSAVIQALSDSFAFNSAIFAGLALLFFDTLLTLPSEISHIWCKTVRLGTILYLLARYMPLVLYLVEIYGDLSNISAKKCNAINHLNSTCVVLALIGIQGLLLARTYAISLQNHRVLGVLGLLIFGAIIAAVSLSVLDNCNITSSQFNRVALVDTIGSVTVIIFDTGVVIVTILSSIETLRLWQKGDIWDKKSLISLVIYQGFVRYGFVLTITVAGTITSKVLRPSIRGILSPLQNSLSAVIVCRFHLALRERHSQINIPSSSTLLFSTIQAARQSVHNAIVAEFGNPQAFSAETMQNHVADQESQQLEEARSAGIELEEFPWATGYSGDVELVGSVVSRSGMAEAQG